MRRLLETIFGMVLLAAAAHAASPSLHNYRVLLHHTGGAYGRRVAAVYAHAGVLMQNPDRLGGDTFWVDVRHEPMQRRGGHFFAKASMQARSQPGGPQAVGAVVQYWVYFQDGSHLKTRDLPLDLDRHVYQTWGKSYVDALGGMEHEFNRRDDASATEGWEVTVRPRS